MLTTNQTKRNYKTNSVKIAKRAINEIITKEPPPETLLVERDGKITSIKSFDPALYEKWLEKITTQLDKVLDDNLYNHVLLPYAFTKTMFAVLGVTQHLVISKDFKVVFLTAPWVNLITEQKLQREIGALKKWFAKDKGGVVETIFECTDLQKLENKLKLVSKERDSILFVSSSLTWFCDKSDGILDLIKKYKLEKKVVWNADEAGREVSSSGDTTAFHGAAQDRKKYKQRKFKTFIKLRKDVVCIGWTGDKKREIVDDETGSDLFNSLVPSPPRGENWPSVSSLREIKWLDRNLDFKETFSDFYNSIDLRQSMLNKWIKDNYNYLTDLAIELLNIKFSGILQIPTRNSLTNHLDFLKEEILKIPVQKHMIGMHAVATTSNETLGWEFTKKGVIELSSEELKNNGYNTDDSLVEKTKDHLSPLKVLFIIDKFVYGGNFPTAKVIGSLKTSSIHEPNSNKKVTLHHAQYELLARGTRRLLTNQEMTEICSTMPNSQIKQKELEWLLNTFDGFLMDVDSNRNMVKEFREDYLSAREVIEKYKTMKYK